VPEIRVVVTLSTLPLLLVIALEASPVGAC
jgi:hypothetical protein